jgi:hypothetical protein
MSLPIIKDENGLITQGGTDIIQLLYKKFNNVTYTDKRVPLFNELTSRPNVYIDQIINEIIPFSPADRQNEFVYITTGTNYDNSFYTIQGPPSDVFANIAFVSNLQLFSDNNYTYKYIPAEGAENIFMNIIFDPIKSYYFSIEVNNEPNADSYLSWSIDTDAGVLAFFDNAINFIDPTTGEYRDFTGDDIIKVNFWKYNGVKGRPTDPNFTNPPNPARDLSCNFFTSQQINLIWKYPITTQYSFGLLPLVETFYYQINPPDGTIKGSSTSFVDPSDTTLIISSLGSPGGFSVNNHIATLTGITNISAIRIWYGNYKGVSTFADLNVSYTSTNPPSIPTNLSLNTPTPQPDRSQPEYDEIFLHDTYSSTLSWTESNPETFPTSESISIESYDISYNSSGSQIRSTSLTPITDSSTGTLATTNSFTFDNMNHILMPDASYNFQVKATNNIGKDSGFSDTLVVYLPPLEPNIPVVFPYSQPNYANGNEVFTSIFTHANTSGSTVQSVNGDTIISNLLIKVPTAISTNGIKWPVQNLKSRGRLYNSTNKTELSIFLTNGATKTNLLTLPLDGSFNGTIMSAKQNGVLINGNYEDSYPPPYPTSYQGFYSDLNINSIAIDNSNFIPSPLLQSLDISDNQGNQRNLLTYFYDGRYINNQNPTISNLGITYSVLSNPIFITGFSVYSDFKLRVITSVSNIGTHFYTQPVLSYTIDGTGILINENNLINLKTSLNVNDGSLKNAVQFSNSNLQLISNTTTNIYRYPFTPAQYSSSFPVTTSPVSLTVTAQNAIGSVTISIFIQGYIIDQPSVNLVQTLAIDISQSIIPTFKPAVSAVFVPSINLLTSRAYRILSNVYVFDLSGSTNNANLNTLLTTNQFRYDNSQNLASTNPNYQNELPIINGSFCFPLANYGPSPQVNFAPGSAIRYATFIWKINIPTGTPAPGNLLFNFDGANTPFNITGTNQNNKTTICINDATNTLIKIDFAILLQNGTSSSWVNGAAIDSSLGPYYQVGSLTGSNLILSPRPIYTNENSSVTPVIGYTLGYNIPPVIIPSGGTGYVMLRVGIPYGSAYTFSTIKANLVV